MALTPSNTPENSTDKRKERAAAQEDVLLREVDEAVRQDELSSSLDKYGKPLLAIVVLGLAAFAAYLFIWVPSREGPREAQSETLVSALDQIEAGNIQTGSATLDGLAAEGEGGAKTAAMMLQAGIAQQQGKAEEAAKIFAAVAADEDAPQAYRDLAVIREITATFDTRKPEDIVARLKPLAVPENAFYGSAGELLAIAYLEQGKRQEAGDLLAAISKSDDVPDSLRSRARQMAGQLGVDAIEDVDEVLEESRIESAPGAPPAQ
ncbi:tetratricopeptide repeat protein [Pontixanthobacter aquaemixtae]|uniref:Tetratricopeptide repeat protein n=1 Tax=Pontixanthobacter aquaemixtae TaxID=1958940 RepID=A0A844ZQE8_9SPHN|nr:tetratricopeptide repeat protein [Pontixanthobacter aquaemixtae]MXO89754.1 tetratricopeptide repeat protein [Pontixanthobacter aquaemixtae]